MNRKYEVLLSIKNDLKEGMIEGEENYKRHTGESI